jgi:hypothetical protein
MRLIAFLILISSPLMATELSPWFGPLLEIEGRGTCLFQRYRFIDTKHGTAKHPANNVFVTLSSSICPKEYWSFEGEVVTSATRHHHFNMDSLWATGRYRWWNDIVGDPVTLVTGLTLSKIYKVSRHDLSEFYHGGIQCEAHLSAGKEFSCLQFWTSRIWGVCGVGFADKGSPWIRGNLAWEHNWWDRHQIKIFANSLWGLGSKGLSLHKHFQGYGLIRHQSVDIGFLFRFETESRFAFSLEYVFRAFANNGPKNVNSILIRGYYPFNL